VVGHARGRPAGVARRPQGPDPGQRASSCSRTPLPGGLHGWKAMERKDLARLLEVRLQEP
jgi:hypothetical protein